MTGVKAGERGSGGQFPEGTVNRKVEDRLAELADARRRFGAAASGDNRGADA